MMIIIIMNHKAVRFTYCLYNHVVREEPIDQIFFVMTILHDGIEPILHYLCVKWPTLTMRLNNFIVHKVLRQGTRYHEPLHATRSQ